jgi:hypothetical protein
MTGKGNFNKVVLDLLFNKRFKAGMEGLHPVALIGQKFSQIVRVFAGGTVIVDPIFETVC